MIDFNLVIFPLVFHSSENLICFFNFFRKKLHNPFTIHICHFTKIERQGQVVYPGLQYNSFLCEWTKHVARQNYMCSFLIFSFFGYNLIKCTLSRINRPILGMNKDFASEISRTLLQHVIISVC